jgi:hypothetical protein
MLEDMSIREKKWKMTASREAMFINNSLSYSDLSEGKRRLYEKALPVFQFLSTTTKHDFLIKENYVERFDSLPVTTFGTVSEQVYLYTSKMSMFFSSILPTHSLPVPVHKEYSRECAV